MSQIYKKHDLGLSILPSTVLILRKNQHHLKQPKNLNTRIKYILIKQQSPITPEQLSVYQHIPTTKDPNRKKILIFFKQKKMCF